MVMYIKNYGKVIRNERKSWGMSKQKLAKLAYTEKEVISEIESGENKNPDFFLMLNICEVLQISVFTLLKNKDAKFL